MLLSLMPELIGGRVRGLDFHLPLIFSIEDRMLNLGVCVCVYTHAHVCTLHTCGEQKLIVCCVSLLLSTLLFR